MTVPNFNRLLGVALLGLALAVAGSAWAQDEAATEEKPVVASMMAVPTMIPFQGYLADDQGAPINQTVAMSVSLYDAATGGTLVWGPEGHSVAVAGGIFQINLGSIVALDPADFVSGGPLHLSVSIDGNPELTPRTQLLSAPFALQSNATGTGGGELWSSIGSDVFLDSGRLGVNVAPGKTLDVNGQARVRSSMAVGGLQEPQSTLDVAGTARVSGDLTLLDGASVANSLRVNNRIVVGSATASAATTLDVHGSATVRDDAAITNSLRVGQKVVVGSATAAPATALDVHGAVTIRGGADIVEGFHSGDGEEIEAGTVMAIDPENSGMLRPSDSAYDSRVAGVVSGAGGVQPGIKLGQDGVMDGDIPVAMSGRVYVKCSAENGPIRPGDRLTTSSTTGHAMVATDRDLADGAVIGKAMSALDSGTGLVLVLVNLQ